MCTRRTLRLYLKFEYDTHMLQRQETGVAMGNGGLCKQHGPYDAPHTVCPDCVREGLIPPPVDGMQRRQETTNQGIQPKRSQPEPGGNFRHLPESERIDGQMDKPVQHDTGRDDLPVMLSFLIVKSPIKYRGRVFRVAPGSIIGRRDADVLINDRRISRQHARVNLETNADGSDYHFVIFDFGTPNGTFVNDTRISNRMILHENDEIRMGEHLFVFKTLRR